MGFIGPFLLLLFGPAVVSFTGVLRVPAEIRTPKTTHHLRTDVRLVENVVYNRTDGARLLVNVWGEESSPFPLCMRLFASHGDAEISTVCKLEWPAERWTLCRLGIPAKWFGGVTLSYRDDTSTLFEDPCLRNSADVRTTVGVVLTAEMPTLQSVGEGAIRVEWRDLVYEPLESVDLQLFGPNNQTTYSITLTLPPGLSVRQVQANDPINWVLTTTSKGLSTLALLRRRPDNETTATSVLSWFTDDIRPLLSVRLRVIDVPEYPSLHWNVAELAEINHVIQVAQYSSLVLFPRAKEVLNLASLSGENSRYLLDVFGVSRFGRVVPVSSNTHSIACQSALHTPIGYVHPDCTQYEFRERHIMCGSLVITAILDNQVTTEVFVQVYVPSIPIVVMSSGGPLAHIQGWYTPVNNCSSMCRPASISAHADFHTLENGVRREWTGAASDVTPYVTFLTNDSTVASVTSRSSLACGSRSGAADVEVISRMGEVIGTTRLVVVEDSIRVTAMNIVVDGGLVQDFIAGQIIEVGVYVMLADGRQFSVLDLPSDWYDLKFTFSDNVVHRAQATNSPARFSLTGGSALITATLYSSTSCDENHEIMSSEITLRVDSGVWNAGATYDSDVIQSVASAVRQKPGVAMHQPVEAGVYALFCLLTFLLILVIAIGAFLLYRQHAAGPMKLNVRAAPASEDPNWVWLSQSTLERNSVNTRCSTTLMPDHEFDESQSNSKRSSYSTSNQSNFISYYEGEECSIRITSNPIPDKSEVSLLLTPSTGHNSRHSPSGSSRASAPASYCDRSNRRRQKELSPSLNSELSFEGTSPWAEPLLQTVDETSFSPALPRRSRPLPPIHDGDILPPVYRIKESEDVLNLTSRPPPPLPVQTIYNSERRPSLPSEFGVGSNLPHFFNTLRESRT